MELWGSTAPATYIVVRAFMYVPLRRGEEKRREEKERGCNIHVSISVHKVGGQY